ncbi:ASB_collapsed_G0030060.mRNA.1.CDS.1 [Saccharomyces cerevisiae]|nr:ASB_collapsed_G0030060.mRNA.1.CDS.1 [Saccharomyces cerevisiae]CAI7355515.1 CFC_collapsed_G0029230.mRNA.1.CDS.1 [Saccharomyces cerevisiae]
MRFQLFIYFYFTIVVIAGTNTIQQFSDAGDRLITSLRNLDNNGTYETLTAEKVPIIEGQIQNISAKYEQHTFILKGLEAVLNYKVKSLDNNERESLEIEYEKVEKALDAALNISPFEYIKKFKEVSRDKVVNALENLSREQNRITINGGREDEKEKEAREKKETTRQNKENPNCKSVRIGSSSRSGRFMCSSTFCVSSWGDSWKHRFHILVGTNI